MSPEEENLGLKKVVRDLQGQLQASYKRIGTLVDRVEKLEKWSHPDRAKEFEVVVEDINKRIDDIGNQ